MSFEQALSTTLAAAVGDDQALVAELRGAFMESVERHVEALRGAETDDEWRDAALRLKGVAASFGATDLMGHADRAAEARRGDVGILGDVARSVTLLTLF